MYRWVHSLTKSFNAAFVEMAEPKRTPTRFECEWAQYFSSSRQRDHAQYVIAVQLPPNVLTRDYFFQTIFDIDNLHHRLRNYEESDFKIPLVFRTDVSYDDQWPYKIPGWIRGPSDIDHPVHHYRLTDCDLIEPHYAQKESGQRYPVNKPFIQGLIMGGRS